MGISDLISLLRKHAPRAFSGPVVCRGTAWIDAPLIVMAAYKKAQADGTTPCVEASISKTVACAYGLGVSKVNLVFDGPTRPAKARTVSTRVIAHEVFAKRCMSSAVTLLSILQTDHAMCDKICVRQLHTFTNLQVSKPFPSYSSILREAKRSTAAQIVIAPHDAEEYIAANMTMDDVAVSIDSDALAFGCPRIVQYLGKPNETWITLQTALEDLQLTQDQFRTLCVVLGNDFSSRIRGVGPVTCLKGVKTLTLEGFAETYRADCDWLAEAQRAKEIFELKHITRASEPSSGQTDTPPLE
jgi:hypothetical protein